MCRGSCAPPRYEVILGLLLLGHVHLLPLSLLHWPSFAFEAVFPDDKNHDGDEYHSSDDTSSNGSHVGSFVGRVSISCIDCVARIAVDSSAGIAVWGSLNADLAFVGVTFQACTRGGGCGTLDAALEDGAHDILELCARVRTDAKIRRRRHSPLRALLAGMVAIVVASRKGER